MSTFYEIQQSLNVLAYGSFPPAHGVKDAQKAANDWAGTTNLDLLAALNCKHYGTTTPLPTNRPMDFNEVCNALAGTTLKEAQDALSNLAGGGHT